MNANEILTRAAGHLANRAKTYDKPQGERSMKATVEAFKAVTGHELTETQGWLFMALLKAVRSQHGAFKMDSFEDGAAYFALAGESASEADLMQAVCGEPLTRLPGKIHQDAIVGKVCVGDGEYESSPMIDPQDCNHNSKRDGFKCPACGFTESTDKFPPAPMGAPVAPSWNDAPDWANWLAQDEDGGWWWFEKKPEFATYTWDEFANGKVCSCIKGDPNPNWQSTLQQRPESKNDQQQTQTSRTS